MIKSIHFYFYNINHNHKYKINKINSLATFMPAWHNNNKENELYNKILLKRKESAYTYIYTYINGIVMYII